MNWPAGGYMADGPGTPYGMPGCICSTPCPHHASLCPLPRTAKVEPGAAAPNLGPGRCKCLTYPTSTFWEVSKKPPPGHGKTTLRISSISEYTALHCSVKPQNMYNNYLPMSVVFEVPGTDIRGC